MYFIPSGITAFGLSIGLFVIFKTCLADPGRDLFSILKVSSILLLIAGLADLADGAVARLIKAESDFGVQFDSLSDSVTFGVAPPLLILKSLGDKEDLGRLITLFVIIAAMIYTLCGVLRLVRYNLQTAKKNSVNFTGLPIPAAASAALSASLLSMSPWIEETFHLSAHTRAWIAISVFIILGYLMISRWKFLSIKALRFPVQSFHLVLLVGVVVVLVLNGILDYFAEVFFILSWSYLLVALALSIIRKIAGKRSATLADFEPDDHEEEE